MEEEEQIINPKIITILDTLIVIDIILIISSLIGFVQYSQFMIFDLLVCALLLIEFFIRFKHATNKWDFTKHNITDLIASLPLDLIVGLFLAPITALNAVRFLRIIRIVKVLRVSVLIAKFFKNFSRFFETTHLDKIFSVVVILILTFTFLFYYFGSMQIDDSFWFVIITLTTVGYSDSFITTENARIIGIVLVLSGVLVFSTITAAISSWFTDKLLEEENVELNENLHILNQKLNFHERELERLNNLLEESNKNYEELKELIENKGK